ncbi:Ig-like domain-containing protein [candidate division KSB1 bacterium]|nr:Ig-like domain-containing protein [candidate division KSB1 bacterium]
MKNTTRFWMQFFTAVFCLFIFSALTADLAADELKVTWNKNTEDDLIGYKVYWGTSSRTYSNNFYVGTDTTYMVPDLSQGNEYFFAVTAIDTANNESAYSDEVSYSLAASDETPPTLVSLQITSATNIEIIFSEQLNKTTAETISNYQINKGIVVSSAVLDENGQKVTLTTSPHSDDTYEITINNIEDLAGNQIATDTKYQYEYDIIRDTFEVTDVQVIDYSHLDITFSNTVDPTSAQNISNYTIFSDVSVVSAVVDGSGDKVHLVTSQHLPDQYIIRISNIQDVENPPNTITESTHIYSVADVTHPHIDSVRVEGETNIYVVFDESIDTVSAETESNYQVSPGITILNAKIATNNTVNLTTTPHVEGSYTLQLSGIKDLADPPNSVDPPISYSYDIADIWSPTIDTVLFTNERQIDVIFSEAVEKNSAELESNYQIFNGVSIFSAELDPDNRTVHLSTSPHSEKVYYLTAVNIKDRAANPNTIADGAYKIYEFVDTFAPYVESVTSINKNLVDVLFSESLDNVSVENIENFNISPAISISSAILDNDGKTVHLTTGNHSSGNYTLSANNAKDLAGNVMTEASNTPYIFVDTTPPTVTEIEIVDGNTLNVHFSEAVEKLSSESLTNYNINNGITISAANLDQNQLFVQLKTSDHSEEVYTITVSGVLDQSIPPNAIDTTSLNYLFNDSEPPEITDVAAVEKNRVKIEFNEKVESVSAENINNYQIENNLQVSNAELDSSEKIVFLTTADHVDGNLYFLTVENIKDQANTPNTIIKVENRPYNYTDSEQPTLVSAQTALANKVIVTFSEPVDEASAETFANYQVNNNIVVSGAVLQPDLVTVELTTSAHVEGDYTVSVSNVKDRAADPNTIAPNSSLDYAYGDDTKPTIASVQAENENLLIVKFSEAVDQTSAEQKSNYSISDGIQINSATLVSDSTVHLATSKHLEQGYTLTVSNVRDRAANPNTILPNSTYGYQYIDTTPPELVAAQMLSENKVTVTFSEPVEQASAELKGNYSISGGIQVNSATLVSDSTVQLATSLHLEQGYTLTVNNVKDRAANPNSIVSNSTYGYQYNDTTPPELVSALAQLENKVVLTFSEPVEQASAETAANYSITNNISVLGVSLLADLKTVELTTSVHVEGDYTVYISNVTDRATNPNAIAPNSSFDYNYVDTIKPTILSAWLDKDHKLIVKFSELLDQTSAQLKSNYSISGGIVIHSATLMSDSTVQLVTSKHQEQGYTLTVNNVKDRAANPNVILPNSTYGYQYNDTTPPELVSAQASLENKVTVTFNEPVEQGSAETVANYSISNNISVLAASLQPDLVTVELTTSVQAEGNYTVSVSNVKDRAVNPNTIAPNSSLDYAYVDNTKPTIASVQLENENLLVVKFSEPVEQASAELKGNYSISDGIQVNSATLVSDSTVQLATSEHFELQYTLTVSNVKDRAANPNSILPNSTYSYQYDDTTPPELVSAQAPLENKVTVSFNEPVEQGSAENAANYTISNNISVLTVSLQPDLKTVELTTSVQTEGDYTVSVSNVKDRAAAPNTIVPNSSVNYAYVDGTKPTIASAQLENDNLLVVKFSEPLEQASAEQKNNYSISGGIQVNSATLVSDSTVHLATSKHIEQPYTLTVNNVKDRAANPNAIQSNSTYSYQYNDTTPPELVSAQAPLENKATVTFNEPVEQGSAETSANYTISNNISVVSASLQPDLVTVELTTSVHAEGDYTVSVSNVRDRATNPNTIAPNSSVNYAYVDGTKPTIASVQQGNENLVIVKFSEPVEQISAELISNYSISDGIQISNATLVSDSTVHLATSKHLELQYTLTVNNIKDRAANPNTILPNSTSSYQYNDTTPPELVSAQAVLENKVTVTFNEPVEQGSAETAANYSISSNVSVLAASLQPDLVTVELTTSVQAEGNYTVSVSNVRDRATNPNTIAPNSSVNYAYVDGTKPTIASVQQGNENLVIVKFSEPVEQISAELISNYSISDGIQISNATLVSDSTVHLATSKHLELQYTLTVNNIKDRAANANTILPNSTYSYQYNDTTPPELVSAQASLENTVTVTFNEPVEQGSAETLANYSITGNISVLAVSLQPDLVSVELTTSVHAEGNYTISVSDVRDRAANPNTIAPNSSLDYAYVDVTKPTIASVHIDKAHKLFVNFSEPVDQTSAQQKGNYAISGGVQIISAALVSDSVVQLITSDHLEQQYTLTVNNIKDRAANPNSILNNSLETYQYTDTTPPTMVDAKATLKNKVLVTFSEAVEGNSAEQKANYTISDGIEVLTAVLISDSEVELVTSVHQEKGYTITANNVRDRAANPNSILPNSTYSYQFNDTTPPELVAAQMPTENKVMVTFSEPVEQASAETAGNYSISNNISVLEASLQADLLTVELITSVHPEGDYTVSASNVKDRATNPNTIAANSALNYSYVDVTLPTIATVLIENENLLTINFSEPVDQVSAEQKGNYIISDGIVISSATLISDSTVQLATSKHQEIQYILNVNNVKDRAANPNTILPSSSYNYQYNDTTPPELVTAQASAENKVTVTFNEPVEQASAETAANYSITNGISVVEATLQTDLMTVELTTSVHAEGNYTVSVSDVKDRAANPNTIVANSALNYTYVDNTKPTIASVSMENENSLLVKFSEPVEQASAELMANYSISGGIVISGATLLSDSTVQLATSKHLEQGYSVTVNNVRDRAANPNTILPNSTYSYQFNDTTPPELVLALSPLENKVSVSFSEPVDQATAENAANYSIANNISVVEAKLQAALMTVELTTSVHAEGNYTVSVSNVKDRAVNPNTIAANSTLNYTYVDVTKPIIASVSVESENSLFVKFSEPVDQTTAGLKTNYNITDGIEISSATLVSDSTVQLITSKHLEQPYTLIVSNVKDRAANQNTIVPNSTHSYQYDDITAPKLVSAKSLLENKVTLTFSEPVEAASAENAANYSITNNIAVLEASLQPDLVTVELTTSVHAEGNYTIHAANVKDRAINPNAITANNFVSYTYVDVTKPTMASVLIEDQNTFLLKFSEPVEQASAEEKDNYAISGGIEVFSAALVSDSTVRLTTSQHLEQQYTLTVSNINDRATTPNTIVPNSSLNYDFDDNTKPTIVDVQIEKDHKLKVTFSEPVDLATAQDKANYSISGNIQIISAALVKDSTVQLVTTKHLEQQYTLTVSNVKDRANNPNTILPNSEFTYQYVDVTPPTLVDVQTQLENKVLVSFSEPVDLASAQLIDNYQVSNNISVISALLYPDLKSVELTTSVHAEGDYTITVNMVKDRAITPNVIAPNSQWNYTYVDNTKPEIASVQIFKEDTVIVKFSEPVDQTTAEEKNNYSISGGIEIYSATLASDSTVLLGTSAHLEQGYTLTVKKVKDRAANQNTIVANSTFDYEYFDITLPTIVNVQAPVDNKVFITFSEPMEETSTGNVNNYSINNNISVLAAKLLGDLKTVELTTTIHNEGDYTVTVNNVKDLAKTPNVIKPNSQQNYSFADGRKPSVVSVQLFTEDTVVVNFSEPVETVSATNINNYNISDNVQIFSAIQVGDSTIKLYTSPHAEKLYTLSVSNVKDRANNPNTIAENTTFSYTYVDKTLPEIEKIEAEEFVLHVTFTEPVDLSSTQNISNYSVEGVNIITAQLDTNSRTVHLSTSKHFEQTYTLVVNNIKDRAITPNTILADSKDNYEYVDVVPPTITEAVALSKDTVLVKFNEPVQQASIENTSNYSITGEIQINAATLVNDSSVYLITSDHLEQDYSLTANNILDRAKNPNEGDNLTFNYEYVDTDPLQLVTVQALVADKVDVTFSKPLDQASALNKLNYSISDNIQVLAVTLNENEVTVHLTTTPHVEATYTLTVNNVTDRAITPNPIGDDNTKQYDYIDTTLPTIQAVTAPFENKVEVVFSEPVATAPAENVSNYLIDGIQIDSASLGENNFTVSLFTSKHTETTYSITINNILDLANSPNKIEANSKFNYEYIDFAGPEIDSVKALVANQVDIYFSEFVDEVTAEDISNYNINNGVKVDSAWLDVDLKTVHLKTSDHTPRNYILTVENVLDRANNPNPVKPGTYAQYVYTDITAPYVTEIRTWEKINVSVTYSEPMDASSVQDTANYQFADAISVESVKLLENQKTVHFITSEHVAGEYSVTINNVFDLAAEPNSIDTTIAYTYIDNDAPQALSAVAESDTSIVVTFDEPIETSSAVDTLNYSINPYVHIASITLDAPNQLVRLNTRKHPEGNFTISVRNIKDVSDSANVMVDEANLNYSFVDIVRPKIDSVYTPSENEVVIVYSEEVDEPSAINPSNYEIYEGGGLNSFNMNLGAKASKTSNDAVLKISLKNNIRTTSSDNPAHNIAEGSGTSLIVLAIALESDQRTVRITTKPQQEVEYSLTVNNVKDLANNPNVIQANTLYKYEYMDVTPPIIYDVAVPIDSVVNVYFSEDLDKTSAEAAANYLVDNNITVKKASLDSTQANLVHLETTSHEYNVNYKITINNVKDKAKKQNVIPANSNKNYTYLDTHAPFVDSTKLVSAARLQIAFNEPLDSTSVMKIENYSIFEDIEVKKVQIDSTGKVVTLVTSPHKQDSTYLVTIENIFDRSNNELAKYETSYSYVKEEIKLVDDITQPDYTQAYINVGGSCYMDDNNKVTLIPKQYAGVMWIKTKKEDLANSTDNFFSFTLSDTSTVCVVYDGNATNPPNWLKNNYEKSGEVITIDNNLAFNVWEAIHVPGEVTLGGNSAEGAENVSNMYLVLIVNETYRRAGAMEDMNDPDDSGEITEYKLFQNYPNPFNAHTDIKFQLPVNAEVELNIFNIRGQLVRELIKEEIGTGSHYIKWDGKDRYGNSVITGQYFIRMIIKEIKHVNSMTLKNITYEKVIKMMYIK